MNAFFQSFDYLMIVLAKLKQIIEQTRKYISMQVRVELGAYLQMHQKKQ